MPRWTARWLDSANRLVGLIRPAPRVGATVGFEAGGRTHPGPAVPWCAAGVVVTAVVAPPVRGPVTLALPGRPPVAPASVTADADGSTHAAFRVPVPDDSIDAVVLVGERPAHAVRVRVLTEDDFRATLSATGGVTALLGGRATAARVVVARQCRGLLAAVTLAHPDTLAPLAVLGVTAELAGPDGSVTPVAVTTGTPTGHNLTLAVRLPAPGRGRSIVRWRIGGRVVHESPLLGVGLRRFLRTVRVTAAGFVADTGRGPCPVRHPPPRAGGRAGPRFTVTARPGWAGVVPFTVRASGGDCPDWTGRLLVTDHPTDVAPGLLDLAARPAVTGFRLLLAGVAAAEVSLRPVPAAGLDAEGAFTPPADFPWTAAADDELKDRLGRLGE